MDFEIKTAEELVDPELEARWAKRREARQGDVLRSILRAFAERGGPVRVDHVQDVFSDWPPARIREELEALDTDDLILLQEDEIRLAYPFSGVPTPFLVRLEDGRERYACCAIDALGMAPMMGQRIEIRSRCHHCGAPLALSATPEGPGPEAAGVMVWVGERTADRGKVADSL